MTHDPARPLSTNYRRGCRCEECRTARREYSRAWREANLDARREYSRAYREANLEAKRDRGRRYDEANREANRERGRAYREANREALRERGRAYREASPGVSRARVPRERAWVVERQRASALSAARSGATWTPEEDALLASSDLPRIELALILGRTFTAVRHRRGHLRKLALLRSSTS